MNIEEEVLQRVVPSDDENKYIQEVVEKVKSKIHEVAEAMKIEIEPILVGSVAKDTHHKDPDIDIFLMFPPSTKREDLESHGIKIGRAVLDEYEKKYAEHPYVYGKFQGMIVEIVPCFKIEDPSQKMSAVDRTPFHTKYIIENQKSEQRNQIRLFKQFLKGIGIYGAENEIEGFSGYLCELLVLHYGDFNNIVTSVKDWKKGETITFDEKEHEKFNDSLTVIDPVDPKRNVASALSEENFAVFIHASREYHKEPKIEFFFPKKPIPKPIADIKGIIEERKSTFLGISFETPQTLTDILHSQIRKSIKSMVKFYESYGFSIIDKAYFVNEEILLLFEFEVYHLPMVKLHRGPPIWHENAKDFLNKWTASPNTLRGPYIKDGNWYVDIKREYMNPKSLIEAKSETISLGSHVNGSMKKGYSILVGPELLDERYAIWLTQFFEKKFSWEY
jgi:tRNA nucleotidyltransferase (CCA-adding enzyme)